MHDGTTARTYFHFELLVSVYVLFYPTVNLAYYDMCIYMYMTLIHVHELCTCIHVYCNHRVYMYAVYGVCMYHSV